MMWLNKRKIDLNNIFSKTVHFYKTHLLFYYCFRYWLWWHSKVWKPSNNLL